MGIPKLVNLDSFKKEIPEKNSTIPTTAHITIEQKKFIDSQKINFSALIRDLLDKVMRDEQK